MRIRYILIAMALVSVFSIESCEKENPTSTTQEPEMVDLGLSVKWASCNIGATRPEEYGRYFAGGDIVGQTWDGSSWSDGGFSQYPITQIDENHCLKPEYDAARVILGGNWRMPTMVEQQELIDNCTCTWTDNYNGTGVAGMIFTGKKAGYTDKYIFLPAAGNGQCEELHFAGSRGYYWSSSFHTEFTLLRIYFYSKFVTTHPRYQTFGQPIRPVSE